MSMPATTSPSLDELVLAGLRSMPGPVEDRSIWRCPGLSGLCPQQWQESLSRLEAAGLVSRRVKSYPSPKAPLFEITTVTLYEPVAPERDSHVEQSC